ncbi:SUKH-3 domain-containing protein [Nocardiopsis alba]|uniref:SUKH-3 domain-containing protein n=1 Tax=Nocardiopsis alba TaxID=53437 RepID=UPI0033D1194C
MDIYESMENFSGELILALQNEGWSPGRKVDVTRWVEYLKLDGYHINPTARVFLESFGGLSLSPLNREGPNFKNDEPLTIDPMACGSLHHHMATELENVPGGSFYPIGEWLSYADTFIGEDGRIVSTGMGWVWGLGENLADSLELAIFANRPLKCLHSNPGLEPWPPAAR